MLFKPLWAFIAGIVGSGVQKGLEDQRPPAYGRDVLGQGSAKCWSLNIYC